MPVTFEQLVGRAREGLGPELEQALSLRDDQLRAVLDRIVKATIAGLGFHVADTTGEVCDPRPKAPEFEYAQRGPRWPGSGRVGGRRR